MLQTASVPSSYSLRDRRKTESCSIVEDCPMADEDDFSDEGEGSNSKGRVKSRRELPTGAVATLKAWLLSPEHFTHPYPTPQDQAMLMQKTGIDKKQLKNWFTNARRRIWKPMLKKQIEQGKLTAAGAGVPGLMIPAIPGASVTGTMDNPHSVQAMRVHYQQAMQQQGVVQAPQPTTSSVETTFVPTVFTHSVSVPMSSAQQFYSTDLGQVSQTQMSSSTSIGTLPQLSSNTQLSKTDSHAVLMELFARDQDLVKQATESARLKAESKQAAAQQANAGSAALQQHPMKTTSHQGILPSVPTLNSWPHFSSITSLNNLGTMPGVRSIASFSGADLASKGGVNKMGNLAQVKSVESMGKNDSYAFLEVFFGERSSTNLSGMEAGKDASNKGGRQSGENEDNEIGLSLEDESPSAQAPRKEFVVPAPMSSIMSSQELSMDSGTLKMAYDDALAARGLISVSRSSEKLTELPAKIQRTLSQDFINKQQQLQQMGQYGYHSRSSPDNQESSFSTQYPGEEPVEPSGCCEEDGHVNVPSNTTCAICHQTNVDTQLRPCGHMYHERCLKPSLQTPSGPPVCPVDNIPMQSALLAVPTDDIPNTASLGMKQKRPDPTRSSWTISTAAAGSTGCRDDSS